MMSSTYEDSTLIEQANACAKSMAFCWIRSVFREVSVQTLKRLWIVAPGDNEKVVLSVTQQHLQACELTCLRLGHFWCQRLRDSGQNQMAEWVQAVMERKRFWESDESVMGDKAQNSAGTETVTTLPMPQEKNTTNDSKEEVEPLPLQSNGNKLIMTKIRQLGERRIGEGPPPLDRVSRTLDELGYKGETAWPYDWSIIEEAARSNVKRLHSETLKGRPRNATSNLDYEVVPKSLVEREQRETSQNTTVATNVNAGNQQEIDTIMASKGRLTAMMERKRKAASAEPSDEQQRATRARAPSPQLACLAREPSHFGENERFYWEYDIVGALSEQERQYLERNMIHHPEEEPAAEFHSVLGALKELGGFHLYLQNREREDLDEMSDKKKRREERKCRKQRLFPRESEKEDRETKRAVTKVARTIDGNKQHWMEFDMGECLLEVVDPDSNQKTLCAFSSLEVMLRDEDAATICNARESQPDL